MYYVLTETEARKLGIIDADGAELEHDATLAQIEAVSESDHAFFTDAMNAARDAGGDRWVIDESGDSNYIDAIQDDPTAKRAIAHSASHNEIVTLDYDNDAKRALKALCEDMVETEAVQEFWGKTGSGEEWRVHMRRSDASLAHDC